MHGNKLTTEKAHKKAQLQNTQRITSKHNKIHTACKQRESTRKQAQNFKFGNRIRNSIRNTASITIAEKLQIVIRIIKPTNLAAQ